MGTFLDVVCRVGAPAFGGMCVEGASALELITCSDALLVAGCMRGSCHSFNTMGPGPLPTCVWGGWGPAITLEGGKRSRDTQ